ncbi:MAG: nucleotidyltransferase domain-containing protein [Clostridiales bacterium]|nr:nucleotidyltransferase domain-containing protein [Clostridiales bacterium]MCC8115471.1 nucleotidyltransferase domain-containing protein [Bacteroidales bacterium]
MIYGVKEKDWNLIISVFSANPRIEGVILYGSRAKATNKPFSDIDFTLLGNSLSRKDLTDAYLALDDLPLPYMYDISIYSQIKNQDLVKEIEKTGIRIY